MAFDESLAQRVRVAIEAACPGADIAEKRMFGGLCVLVNGNMACGVLADRLMVRVAKEDHDACLALPHTSEMDFTGRPMRGFLYVHAESVSTGRDLNRWVARCSAYALSLPPKQKAKSEKAPPRSNSKAPIAKGRRSR